ncbi:MAG: GNAT family N-acetyltransferase [Pseudomonadales bacterium]
MSELAKIDIPAEHDVCKADDSDIEYVCDILANAFTDDPILSWVSGHKKIYGSLFRCEVEALYKHHGQVYINREKSGAAMWLPAGVSSKQPFHWRLIPVLWKMMRTGGLQSLMRGGELDKIMAANHPQEPHFYLHAIGAQLGNQGRGIGSSLMKAGLKACDGYGVPAYLESSNERNNPLYERYGFEIIGEMTLPDCGPTMWFMRRESR